MREGEREDTNSRVCGHRRGGVRWACPSGRQARGPRPDGGRVLVEAHRRRRRAASWEQAAKLFKGVVTKEQWTQALAGVRPPLGKVVSRKLTSRQYSEKLPGAPDGKYVVIQYETVFEKKASAVETITPMLDPDGVWRVSGYLIR